MVEVLSPLSLFGRRLPVRLLRAGCLPRAAPHALHAVHRVQLRRRRGPGAQGGQEAQAQLPGGAERGEEEDQVRTQPGRRKVPRGY